MRLPKINDYLLKRDEKVCRRMDIKREDKNREKQEI
jgi:hypothetical protein